MLNQEVHKSNYTNIIIIVDDNTKEYCLPILDKQIDFNYSLVVIAPGDANKNIDTLQLIWKKLLNLGIDRQALIINLGGGIVTDIGGFAASTFKRGIDFVHIPTSLLAMVDAAIGGKNGINFLQAKNQLGVINSPKFIIINEEFINTLPPSEFNSGFAEMLKHSLIADESYWIELMDYKINDKGSLIKLIKKSVEIKNEIILKDPYENSVRKSLNFGHTLGHAIESYLTYTKKTPISHGHAVAIGMILASYISSKQLFLEFTNVDIIKKNIHSIFPHINFTNNDIEKIIAFLQYDKKNIGGAVMFVLLEKIGSPVYNQIVSDKLIRDAFAYYAY